MPNLHKSLGIAFINGTKLDPNISEKKREVIGPSEPFKQYPGAETVELPQPEEIKEADLWETIGMRRSIRSYKEGPIGLNELSILLWATQGITARAGNWLFRAAPSAGALYPIETYLVVNNIQGLENGIYHYNVIFGLLEQLANGDFGKELGQCCLGQPMCWKAQVVFVWSAVFRRTLHKYGSRGMRYIFMDVAHICQNLLLASTGLGLGACPIGAFFDDDLNALFGLDGKEEGIIYLASVGIPKRQT